ncbi:hypothetical protein E7T06_03090 [Deinococcus sp. Arct2-2]|uniref:hypothetical protein n=1 Tax=Deinococcus sp. Arct2-2 TaxID=2568653 RepID=UPI0010A4314F|nr:hypothetical protein [Deinococcus sp. Arct2-2]THF71341.1 hypothetical protein E7T06_03090 [Deinococcus sp. Arct2-2]
MTDIPSPQLITITFVVTDPDPEDEDSGMSPLVSKLLKEIDDLLESNGPNVESISAGFGKLPTQTSDRCAKCGVWTSDRNEKLYPEYTLLNVGTTYNGKLLCDLCLPEDHLLHF